MNDDVAIRFIEVVLHEPYLRDWISYCGCALPDDEMRDKLRIYRETYAAAIREAYPGAQVTVISEATNGYKRVMVNDSRYGSGHGWDGDGLFSEDAQAIGRLEETLIDRLPADF